MCMLIIPKKWKNKNVCMRLMRYMRETFLKLDATLNDKSVQGNINESVFLHTIEVSNKDTLFGLLIKYLPLLRGNSGPCMRIEYAEVGHFRFESTRSLVGDLILDKYMRRYILDVCCTVM